jgi:hypothetical protein
MVFSPLTGATGLQFTPGAGRSLFFLRKRIELCNISSFARHGSEAQFVAPWSMPLIPAKWRSQRRRRGQEDSRLRSPQVPSRFFAIPALSDD